MKKLIVILITVLLLAGCSNTAPESEVSEGSEVFFTYPDGKSYTKADLYEDMMAYDITSTLTSVLTNKIAELEEIDIDTIQTEAEEYVQEMIDAGYEYMITYYYGSAESYIAQYVDYDIMNKLCEKKIDENFDETVSEYAPYKAEIVSFQDAETAAKVLEEAQKGENTFAYIASENGYDSEVETTIYTDKSDLPIEVKDYVANTTELGLSAVIETSEVTTDENDEYAEEVNYYIVNLVSKDVDEFKDEFIETAAADLDQDEVFAEYLAKHEIKVHDQRVYDLLAEEYEVIE